ncbi:hypothetical protein IG631_17652 [Alternaria alternata]|nr:hypothetical protein IG631_17652 [Alternaria alternata]
MPSPFAPNSGRMNHRIRTHVSGCQERDITDTGESTEDWGLRIPRSRSNGAVTAFGPTTRSAADSSPSLATRELAHRSNRQRTEAPAAGS